MRICIVTTQHVSYNPRVVKEADALTEAGYDVTVVGVTTNDLQHRFDQELMSSRQWLLATVDYRRAGFGKSFRWLWTGCRKEFFERLASRITLAAGFAEGAHGREHSELRRLACRHRADLYIAHHVQALGAAYHAARHYGAGFAFDAEDFHTGEYRNGENPHRVATMEYLERKYLPRCDYVTASSEEIARSIEKKYGIGRPQVILNVFPLTPPLHRRALAKTLAKGGDGLSLYWYSQMIGPGRGLEEAVRAVGALSKPCRLHLRGKLIEGFGDLLNKILRQSGSVAELCFHPPAPPEQLVQLAAEHDVGLCLETGKDLNNMLASSNKLFTYMLAGLAVIATDTPGQKGIIDQAPSAGTLCRMADSESLEAAIEGYISHPEKLAAAKRASREAAETLFNWDIEKKKLIRVVEDCLAHPKTK